MEMKKRGMSALALLGSLLLMSGAVQASETLNTILGGGAGGVAGTMIGKELGGDTGALVGAAVGGAAGGAATANKGNKNEAALGGAVGSGAGGPAEGDGHGLSAPPWPGPCPDAVLGQLSRQYRCAETAGLHRCGGRLGRRVIARRLPPRRFRHR